MKKVLQGFGIGLFVAGATITLLTQFTDFQQSKDNDEIKRLQTQLQAAEQEIATLNEAVAQASVHTEQPATDASTNDEPTEKKQADSTNEKNDAKAKENDTKQSTSSDKNRSDSTSVTGTILIYEGVSLYDIGKQAEDQGIVQNGRELELYLYKPEYARSLQKGHFELSSDMSFEEMARILTGKQ